MTEVLTMVDFISEFGAVLKYMFCTVEVIFDGRDFSSGQSIISCWFAKAVRVVKCTLELVNVNYFN